MMTLADIYATTYGALDGYPVIYNVNEAWMLVDGTWVSIHPAEAAHNAGILTKAQFTATFGDVQPPAAFKTASQSGGKPERTAP